MSPVEAALLGLIAGSTIFLGLPIGRVRTPMLEGKALLNGIATGVLIFLLWDVLSHAWAPIEVRVIAKHYASATSNGLVMLGGFGLGLLGLIYYDRWMARRATRAPRPLSVGPGAAAVTELHPRPLLGTQPRRLALFIAIGIGLHNFAEGLAIGQSAAQHEIALATLLVIGFALHNATEGFGIVAPLAAETERPSWRTLALLGVIGGGPTFAGTIIGRSFVSNMLSIGFLSLAAGSILYVVIELLAVGRRLGMKVLLTSGLFVGVTLGFVTDAIVTAAGG